MLCGIPNNAVEVCELLLKSTHEKFESVLGTENKLRLESRDRKELLSTGRVASSLAPSQSISLLKPEKAF